MRARLRASSLSGFLLAGNDGLGFTGVDHDDLVPQCFQYIGYPLTERAGFDDTAQLTSALQRLSEPGRIGRAFLFPNNF